MKRGTRPSSRASRSAISTSNPTTRVGSLGSASTNGAPPSASPPHRRAGGGCAAAIPARGSATAKSAKSAAARNVMKVAHIIERMREWNAEVYHRVSDPQVRWGLPVLARLPLDGSELVIDVGCGTGRLTEKLVERLPRGQVVAIDLSVSMLAAARQ